MFTFIRSFFRREFQSVKIKNLNKNFDFNPEVFKHSFNIYISRDTIDRIEYNYLNEFIQSLPNCKREYFSLTVNLKRKIKDVDYPNEINIELKNSSDIIKFLNYIQKDIINTGKN